MNPTLCEQVLLSAMAKADGEAAPLEDTQVKEHLDHCPACRQAVERLDPSKLVPASLRRARPEDDLWPAIKQRIQEDSMVLPTGKRASFFKSAPGRVALAAAACLFLAVGGLWLANSSNAPQSSPVASNSNDVPRATTASALEKELVVLELPPKTGASEPTLPYMAESEADVIAIGVMEKPIFFKGQKLLQLKLLEVLKGNAGGPNVASADGFPPFGCIPPKDPKSFTELNTPGTRVGIYLRRNPKGGWTTQNLVPLDQERERGFRAFLKPYVDVLAARHAADPAARYRELLMPKGGVQLDMAEWRALFETSDPQAADVLREMFAALAKGNGPPQVVKGGYATPHSLAVLLARVHDVKAIDPLMKHVAGQPEDKRHVLVGLLPELCRDADAKTRAAVRAQVKRYVDEYKGDRQQPAYIGLKQAYERLQKL